MKAKIHPKYGKAIVTCACGNSFETGSTAEKLEVEICSACHPFYTGKQKFVDTAGRVDRFKEMQEKAAQMKKELKESKKNKAKTKAKKKPETKKAKKAPSKKKSASPKKAKKKAVKKS